MVAMTVMRLFESPDYCVVQTSGRELTIIDSRTEAAISTIEIPHISSLSSHVVSMSSSSSSNRLAYMLDRQTIAVKDLVSGGISTMCHPEHVDFLEINCGGNYVLFRDGQKALHLYSVDSQSTAILLDSGCRYAQWVPNSNTIVAQSSGRPTMHVWYDSRQPNHSVTHAISGAVTGIVKSKDKAYVLLQNGASQVTHPLQKELIDLWSTSPKSIPQNHLDDTTRAALFQWLLDTRQLEKAADIEEREGNFVASAKLYAEAGLPLMAAQLVADYNIKRPRDMLESIACDLEKDGGYKKASDLFLRIDQPIEAKRVLSSASISKSGSDAGDGQSISSSKKVKQPSELKALPPQELTAEDLLASRQYETALNMLSSKDQWGALWEAASSHDGIDPDLLSRYAATRARQLLRQDVDINDKDDKITEGRQNRIEEALELLIKYCPSHQEHEDLFDELGRKILHRTKEEEGGEGEGNTLLPRLKTLLSTAATKYDSDTSRKISEMLHATHYLYTMQMCSEHGLDDLRTKCAITLLRYSGVIPADKAFYLAGVLCKDQGHTNLAFILLNRYVDLVEAIEGEAMVDSDDFDNSSIIPSIVNAPIPSTHYVSNEGDREEVRDWVLSTCMDSSIEKELPSCKCTDGTIYAGVFLSDNPQCIVTGFPVSPSDHMILDDGCIASARDWNTFVSKVKKDPWTGEDARPSL